MAKKPVLGKGLGALMGEDNTAPLDEQNIESKSEETSQKKAHRAATPAEPKTFDSISIAQIETNPFQPRHDFSREELEELAGSIREMGIIQPITVRRTGSRYEIISGERRLRAARMAGLESIPAYIRDVDDKEMRIMALVENLQREDLNAIEVATSYQQILDECQFSHEELAGRVGKSRAAITNHLRLLKLPASVQDALVNRRISMGHARALLGLEEIGKQEEALAAVIEKDLSVRKTEELVRLMVEKHLLEQEAKEAEPEPDTQSSKIEPELLKALQTKLGWGVSVASTAKGSGKITIAFRTEGEREELLKKLLSIE